MAELNMWRPAWITLEPDISASNCGPYLTVRSWLSPNISAPSFKEGREVYFFSGDFWMNESSVSKVSLLTPNWTSRVHFRAAASTGASSKTAWGLRVLSWWPYQDSMAMPGKDISPHQEDENTEKNVTRVCLGSWYVCGVVIWSVMMFISRVQRWPLARIKCSLFYCVAAAADSSSSGSSPNVLLCVSCHNKSQSINLFFLYTWSSHVRSECSWWW